MKKQVIAYLHTHWDREWYREFEVFRLRLLKVFDNVLEMLESGKIPSFYFDGQVVALLDYLEIRPEKEQLIRQLIREKKLFIGPFYCLIDEFLTDKTTFEKNLEIGLKIARDFGCEDFIGYFVDTFGHSKNVPPILQKFGINKAMVWRGVPDLPSEFIFNGVNTINMVRGYFMDIFSSENSIETKAQMLEENLNKIAEKSGDILLLPIGADHLGVEKDIVEQINAVNHLLQGYEIKLSNPFEYFELVKDNFHTEWNDELRDCSRTFILPGSYSARTRIKQYRAETSYRLEQADKLQKAYGSKYDSIIEYAYKLLLQNQAHDSICGCSTDAVHLENYSRYEKILQIATTVINELKVSNQNVEELIKISDYEFLNTEPLNGYKVLASYYGFDDKILYNTQRIPVTEQYQEIFVLKKLPARIPQIEIGVAEHNIAIEGVDIEFVRYNDAGDTYNYGPVQDDQPEFATIYDVTKYNDNDSLVIRSDFFNITLTRSENLVNFKLEWNNQLPNKLWQIKFNLREPITRTFSEDMNSIIERTFDPNYDMRQNLPQQRGIELKTNFAPMQRFVGAQGLGIITKGLTEYEVRGNSLLITLLRGTGIISNPENTARTTPAGPPIEVPGAQQLGYNCAEFSMGFFEPEDYEKYVNEVYPQIVQ